MMRYGINGMHLFSGWLISAVIGLVLVALAVLAIVALVQYIHRANRKESAAPAAKAPESGDAVRILDERFAKGEIDEEEYTRKKELLQKP